MNTTKLDLTGRTALVTGASAGIGLATAQLLAKRGARVMMTGRDAGRLDTAAASIPGAIAVVSDAADESAIDTLAGRVAQVFGQLDILVLNAGITPFKPLGGWQADELSGLYGVNVVGPFLTVQALAPRLAEGGAIVLVSSIAGHRGGGR